MDVKLLGGGQLGDLLDQEKRQTREEEEIEEKTSGEVSKTREAFITRRLRHDRHGSYDSLVVSGASASRERRLRGARYSRGEYAEAETSPATAAATTTQQPKQKKTASTESLSGNAPSASQTHQFLAAFMIVTRKRTGPSRPSRWHSQA